MSATAPLRLALLCDCAEEGWTSMDLVGDMLFDQMRARFADTIRAHQIKPQLRRRLTAWNQLNSSHAMWNADRLWNRAVEYPRWLRKQRANYDVFHIIDHSYSHLALELPHDRTIVTCHDLDAFRCLIEPLRERRPLWYRRMTARLLRGFQSAAHVVFVSETVRDEAIAFSLVASDRSSVLHNGVTAEFSEGAFAEAGKLLRSVRGGPILLHVGSTVPRKRIDVLLKVFAAVLAAYPKANLVRAGGTFTREQDELAKHLGVDHAIVHLPFVDRAVLTAVYRRATLLLQPSEAEGFGLPLVEAMVCGCPVVASDLPVLREVGGTAAAYCPVGNVSAWTNTVLRVLKQHAIQSADWREFQSSSVSNAGRFSWKTAADSLIDLYQKVSQVHPRD